MSDNPTEDVELRKLPDFGTLAISVLNGADATLLADAGKKEPGDLVGGELHKSGAINQELIGSVGKRIKLAPGEERSVNFVVTWHFPNLSVSGMENVGREYAARFENALAVARYVAGDFERLSRDTKLWRDTWYDSSLPYWFLDRTMANTSTLATTTVYRFENGLFWAWEGIGCCPGTCTHVWHYAQAQARLFPSVARQHRMDVDLGIAQHPDGSIGHRSTLDSAIFAADDGHFGRILSAYREHQMSPDSDFLDQAWPSIRKAILFMIKRDDNLDGILEGKQHNTLDAAWYGRISFLASLYLAMLRAGREMALEIGDSAVAEKCGKVAEKGAKTIEELYNGEYFFQEIDPARPDNIGIGTGCYIDQIFGQFWAHQLGLGHVTDPEKVKSALSSLYRYNFVPNVGRFREVFKRGRWYAIDDDMGLIMCSWPNGGLNRKWHEAWQFMYFNECMSGFEWQAAANMISEGLVQEGLTVARAIHDRYDATKRNPYNEVECSDHYSRAMASYGAFLAACGYDYHGPKAYLAFDPKLSPTNFKAAFTSAEGWGTFAQNLGETGSRFSVAVKWGSLRLKTLAFTLPERPGKVRVTVDGKKIGNDAEYKDGRLVIKLDRELVVDARQKIEVHV